jgi:hypothetical protein
MFMKMVRPERQVHVHIKNHRMTYRSMAHKQILIHCIYIIVVVDFLSSFILFKILI